MTTTSVAENTAVPPYAQRLWGEIWANRDRGKDTSSLRELIDDGSFSSPPQSREFYEKIRGLVNSNGTWRHLGLVQSHRESLLSALTNGLREAKSLGKQEEMAARSAISTALLLLLDAAPVDSKNSPDVAALNARIVEVYDRLVESETDPALKRYLVGHAPPGARTAETTPPYESWFKDGTRKIGVSIVVDPDFINGFLEEMKYVAIKVGERQHGADTIHRYQVTHKGIEFDIEVTKGEGPPLARIDDPSSQMLVYFGHSGWGQRVEGAVQHATPSQSLGKDKVVVIGTCVGSEAISPLGRYAPDAQIYNTSGIFYGTQSRPMLVSLLLGVSERETWQQISDRAFNAGVYLSSSSAGGPDSVIRNLNVPGVGGGQKQYVDWDGDGKSDPDDPFFNVHEKRPGAANMQKIVGIINRLSQFSYGNYPHNPDLKVVSEGVFSGSEEVIKVSAIGDGRIGLKINEKYLDQPQGVLSAWANYEFTRYLQENAGIQGDAAMLKLARLVEVVRSLQLSPDLNSKHEEFWQDFLKRFNLPDIPLTEVKNASVYHPPSYEHGRPQLIKDLMNKLPPEVLDQLRRPDSGRPPPPSARGIGRT